MRLSSCRTLKLTCRILIYRLSKLDHGKKLAALMTCSGMLNIYTMFDLFVRLHLL